MLVSRFGRFSPPAALGRSEILIAEIPELGDRPPPLHVGDVWSPGNRPHLGADQSPAISPGAPSVTTSSGSASPSMRWADVYVPHVSPASMAMGRRRWRWADVHFLARGGDQQRPQRVRSRRQIDAEGLAALVRPSRAGQLRRLD